MSARSLGDEPHALYRFYAADGTLLYIGITADPGRRWGEHAGEKVWWTEVVQVTIERRASRQSVLDAERAAIVTEHPLYNGTYNKGQNLGDFWEDPVLARAVITARRKLQRPRRRIIAVQWARMIARGVASLIVVGVVHAGVTTAASGDFTSAAGAVAILLVITHEWAAVERWLRDDDELRARPALSRTEQTSEEEAR